MGLDKFKEKLMSGEIVKLQEVKLCNPGYGLRGIVDILEIQYDKDASKFKVIATELKSGYYKTYMMQLHIYGLMLSDKNTRLLFDTPKKVVKEGDKEYKRTMIKLYPEQFKLDMDLKLFIMKQNQEIVYDFIRGNVIVGKSKGIVMGLLNIAKKHRAVHEYGLYNLADIPECKDCNPKWCGFWDKHCSKVTDEDVKNSKQRYFGKKDLIKTKPRWVG